MTKNQSFEIDLEESVKALDLSFKQQEPIPSSTARIESQNPITTFLNFSNFLNLMMRPHIPSNFPTIPNLSSPVIPQLPLPRPQTSFVPISSHPVGINPLGTLSSLAAMAPILQSPKSEVSTPSIQRKKNSYKDAPKLIYCPIDGCNQKFPWKSSLKRHILTHTGKRRTPFKPNYRKSMEKFIDF